VYAVQRLPAALDGGEDGVADWVSDDGLGLSLVSAIKRSIAACSATIAVKTPSRYCLPRACKFAGIGGITDEPLPRRYNGVGVRLVPVGPAPSEGGTRCVVPPYAC
jgi:hypothetical protein